MCVCVCESHSLRPHGLQPARLPVSMEFTREKDWSGLTFPSLGDLPNPGIKPGCPALQADSLPSEAQGKSILAQKYIV